MIFTKQSAQPVRGQFAQRPFKSLESFQHDGVEIARLRRRRPGRALAVKQIFYFLVAVVSFKVFLYLQMGGAAYGAKMAELSSGAMMEQAAGWVMKIDPVSQFVLDQVKGFTS